MSRALVLALLLLTAAPAPAFDWKVDPARSAIGFSSDWNGATVKGRFAKWAASIRFDPAKLADARIDVTIDLASAVTGDQTVDGSLPGADWLAVKTVPTARFTSSSVKAAGPGRYVAVGTLTLRGKAVPVTLPFNLTITGNTAAMGGTVTLDRRHFGIGMESDAAGRYVAFPVPVTIAVAATR